MVVRIVDDLHPLDIDQGVQVALYHQVALCGPFCRHGFHNHLHPFTGLDHEFLVFSALLNLVVRESTDNRLVLVNLGPESHGISSLRIHVKALHDVHLRTLRDLQRVLAVVIVLLNRRLTTLGRSRKLLHRGIVHRLVLNSLHLNLDRRGQHIEPPVCLIGIGNDRTAENLAADLLHMVKQILHVQEVHHAFIVDDRT